MDTLIFPRGPWVSELTTAGWLARVAKQLVNIQDVDSLASVA